MTLLSEKDQKHLREMFANQLQGRVRLVMFTQETDCQYCSETQQIVEELAALSEKIEAEIINFAPEGADAEGYGIDKIPAIVVLRVEDELVDYGIRYFGIPSGYEFSSMVEDILMVSSGDSGLGQETKDALAALEAPVHFQVFVTPTCPYCPQAVRLAHQMAMESELVKADMVEAMEFPHLSNKYQVMGVPRTVINEDFHLEGAAPEAMVMAKVKEALAHGGA